MSSTDTLEIRQLARQFAESELRPHTEKWDHERTFDPAAMAHLAELGFFGMLIPEAFGGMEFDLPTYVSALEEIAWGEPSAAITVAFTTAAAQLILDHGSDAQKRQWLENLAQGNILGCIAVAESDGGLQTTAKRSADGWILNGTKSWVTNASSAEVALVLAKGESGPRVFVVPKNTPGLSVTHREDTLGLRPLEIATLKLENIRVDAEAALGEDARAQIGMSVTGSLGMAAIAVGISQAALDHALGYADIREQFNTKLREFEGLQYKLADMATRTEAARALLHKAAQEATPALAAMAKVFASESAMWVTTHAVQIFGGYGYMRDYPVEKLMRDAKATELLEGTNEIQRVRIALELYA
jgi:alkylation response protein AidB-like acyl-CoA dehydrogenase